jgi:hypothetical protein
MNAVIVDEQVLFALDERECMFPFDRAPNASKARYHGWKILTDVGYVEVPFDPRYVTASRCLMARTTASVYAELTHRSWGR